MVILFLLGGVQGAIGWIMVKSGLVPEKYFVGHIELTTHFVAALVLLSYTLWFALSLLPAFEQKTNAPSHKKLLMAIFSCVLIQLIYGGFMAGLKAASVAPTWPSINGFFMPPTFVDRTPMLNNIINNPIAIHFIHRGMAYLIALLSVYYFIKTTVVRSSAVFKKLNLIFIALIGLQIVLGITALLTSTQPNNFVVVGVAHQFVAMLVVMCLTSLLYLYSKSAVTATV